VRSRGLEPAPSVNGNLCPIHNENLKCLSSVMHSAVYPACVLWARPVKALRRAFPDGGRRAGRHPSAPNGPTDDSLVRFGGWPLRLTRGDAKALSATLLGVWRGMSRQRAAAASGLALIWAAPRGPRQVNGLRDALACVGPHASTHPALLKTEPCCR
jgi:hypothetical protein